MYHVSYRPWYSSHSQTLGSIKWQLKAYLTPNSPRVSPIVAMVLDSTSMLLFRLDKTIARCGLQSPHFSSPQHYEKNTKQIFILQRLPPLISWWPSPMRKQDKKQVSDRLHDQSLQHAQIPLDYGSPLVSWGPVHSLWMQQASVQTWAGRQSVGGHWLEDCWQTYV